MKNFPADIMRSIHLGPIVGIDVTRGRNITAEDVARPASVWRWILSGDWRKGPPIVSLLMRAATVSTGRDIAANREASDVLILPKMDEIDLRDWKAYEPAVAAGQAATTETLAKLTRPVIDLRRRSSLEGDVGHRATRGDPGAVELRAAELARATHPSTDLEGLRRCERGGVVDAPHGGLVLPRGLGPELRDPSPTCAVAAVGPRRLNRRTEARLDRRAPSAKDEGL